MFFSFPAHGLHSWTNSITTTGIWEILIQFNVVNYIELLKNSACKTVRAGINKRYVLYPRYKLKLKKI